MTDAVNHPDHYKKGKFEVIDVIEDAELGFHLGNVIKYILRAGKKKSVGKTTDEKELEDLKKAQWYLDRHIANLEDSGKKSNIIGPASDVGPQCPRCKLVMIMHEGEYICAVCKSKGRK